MRRSVLKCFPNVLGESHKSIRVSDIILISSGSYGDSKELLNNTAAVTAAKRLDSYFQDHAEKSLERISNYNNNK